MASPARQSRRDGKIYLVYEGYQPVAETTVKISQKTRRELDALQAKIQLKSGRRLTKGSIVGGLVRDALEQEDEPLIMLRAPEYPLPEKIRKMIRNASFDWGVETKEEDIDRILYGERN
jgi:hypothetical protein